MILKEFFLMDMLYAGTEVVVRAHFILEDVLLLGSGEKGQSCYCQLLLWCSVSPPPPHPLWCINKQQQKLA